MQFVFERLHCQEKQVFWLWQRCFQMKYIYLYIMLEYKTVRRLVWRRKPHRGWTWTEKHRMKSNRQKIENSVTYLLSELRRDCLLFHITFFCFFFFLSCSSPLSSELNFRPSKDKFPILRRVLFSLCECFILIKFPIYDFLISLAFYTNEWCEWKKMWLAYLLLFYRVLWSPCACRSYYYDAYSVCNARQILSHSTEQKNVSQYRNRIL